MAKGYENQGYQQKIARRSWILLLLGTLLLLMMVHVIALGSAGISVREVYGVLLKKVGLVHREFTPFVEGVILQLRLPRILLAVLAGIALGSGGAVMQGVLNNPLASPYTLGISSGSAFGAALAIVLGDVVGGSHLVKMGSWSTVLGAFSVGLLTMCMIYILTSLKGGSASVLILAGVALSYFFSSGISLLKYLTNLETLQELTLWLMGGLYRAAWADIAVLAPIVAVGTWVLFRMSWDLNVLIAGEEVAQSLGINPERVRRKGCFLVALLTSAVIAFTGVIGFIGLVAPHLCRMFLGNDNRFLVLASGIMGAIFLLGADTVARLLINPSELPVGIITSLCGVPFFLYMLVKKRREYWQ